MFDFRRPDDPPALLAQPNAEIDIVESNREALVKSIQFFKDLAPYRDARGGDATEILLQPRATAVAVGATRAYP